MFMLVIKSAQSYTEIMIDITSSDQEQLSAFRDEWSTAGWGVIAEPIRRPFSEGYSEFMAALFSPDKIDEVLNRLNSEIAHKWSRNNYSYGRSATKPDPLAAVPNSEWMYHGESFVYSETVSGVCVAAVRKAIEVYGVNQVPRNPQELRSLAIERTA